MLRWKLVLPVSLAVWYGVFAIGLYTHLYIENNSCPPNDLISGLCHNSAIQAWLNAIKHILVFLSAGLVVVSAATTAPSHKVHTAVITLLAGLSIAFYISLLGNTWTLFFAAFAGGIMGTGLTFIRTCKHPPNKTSEPSNRSAIPALEKAQRLLQPSAH